MKKIFFVLVFLFIVSFIFADNTPTITETITPTLTITPTITNTIIIPPTPDINFKEFTSRHSKIIHCTVNNIEGTLYYSFYDPNLYWDSSDFVIFVQPIQLPNDSIVNVFPYRNGISLRILDENGFLIDCSSTPAIIDLFLINKKLMRFER